MMEAERTRVDALTSDTTVSWHSDREARAAEDQKLHEECSTRAIKEPVVAGSNCPEGSCHRALRLLVYICILIFSPSVHRCAGPLGFFVQRSPAFLNQGEPPKEKKLLLLADAFAVSGSTGLLTGLALSTLLAPRTSPKVLGLLCIAAAACGLLLSVTAKSAAALTLGLFFLGLPCATTNAVLPIVACFRNPAAVFTTICATDFASVIPLQILQFLVEYYGLDLREVVCAYVVTVYPLLFMLAIACIPRWSFPVGDADFYEPLDAAEHPKKNADDRETWSQHNKKSQGCRVQKRQEDRCEKREESTVQRRYRPSGIHETPPLWNLSLKEQLRSADIYGISLWWCAISIGLESFRLYLEQSIVAQAGQNAQRTSVAAESSYLQTPSTWSTPCLVLVLPTLHCLHLGLIRLGRTTSTVQMTPYGIGLFASIFLALAALLCSTEPPLLCASGVVIGNVVQALAPTAMFIMLTNAYGLKRLSLFQAIEIILLAGIGFLMPLLRPWLLEDIKVPALRLPRVLLVSAVVSFVSLMYPRCRRSRPTGSNAIHVLATGIPLAVERSSMIAVFSQAGFPCRDTDIPAKEPPGKGANPSEDERRALLVSEDVYVDQC